MRREQLRDYDKLDNVRRLTYDELVECVEVLRKYVSLKFDDVYVNTFDDKPDHTEISIQFNRCWIVNPDHVTDKRDIEILEKII